MSVSPLGPRSLAAVPRVERLEEPERAARQEKPQTAEASKPGEPVRAAKAPDQEDWPEVSRDELAQLAAAAQVRLELRPVPEAGVVLVRFLDPETGAVVREFPPAERVLALAELRARAAARIDLRG